MQTMEPEPDDEHPNFRRRGGDAPTHPRPTNPVHRHRVIAAYVAAAVVVSSPIVVIQILPIAPKTRTYYIAADEVQWDYAPDGSNKITGQPFGPLENTWMSDAPDRIGHIYLKAILREYADGNFTAPRPRTDTDLYLGTQGPVLRAEGADTIRLVFRNNAR